ERDALIPKKMESEIKESILKKKAILATDIALKFDIRVSTAKVLLKQYMEEGIIKLFDPKMKLKVYIPTSQ
ncbi:MAG: 30S ribosomal protein S25e, partial [Candidatus Lokiarchaeum sp. GC14_75]